jgi:FkbM family methyltransferase
LTIGFDPNPFVFSILEKNSTLNTDKYKIIPEKYAISAKSEEYFFISSEASFANGGISEKSDSKHGKFVLKEKINGVNLKKFLETKYPDWISKLSFIKIDAEGYDKEIIKSISDLIKKYNPVIVAESFGKASDDAKKELFDVIKSNDYTIYYFEDFNIDLKIEKLNSNTDMTKFNHTINVYGIPNK